MPEGNQNYFTVRCTKEVKDHLGIFKPDKCFDAFAEKPDDANSPVWVGIKGLSDQHRTFTAMDFSLHFVAIDR